MHRHCPSPAQLGDTAHDTHARLGRAVRKNIRGGFSVLEKNLFKVFAGVFPMCPGLTRPFSKNNRARETHKTPQSQYTFTGDFNLVWGRS